MTENQKTLSVCAIEKQNSVGFLDAIFAAYQDELPIVLVDDASNLPEMTGAEIVKSISPIRSGGWFKEIFQPVDGDAPAQIIFTSGTTGKPKPIVLPHRALADVTQRLIQIMEPDDTIREYIGVPVYFSFGLARARMVSAIGGEVYIPENGFDPAEIARMLACGEINAFSAVPTLIRVVLNNADLFKSCAPKLKWIEIGSQYMSRQEKEALKNVFPSAKIVQHYGLTEASRTTFLDISNTTGRALESVGIATGDVKISFAQDNRIKIKGSHVALGILSDDGIAPIVDGEGWLTTNDFGSVEDGYLFYQGRADDIINVGGVKISPELFDERLGQLLGVPNITATARIPDAQRGDGIFIAVARSANADLSRVKREALRVAEVMGLSAAGAIKVACVNEIPYTPTGKVKREAVGKLFDKSAKQDPVLSVSEEFFTEREAEIAAIWKAALGIDYIERDQSFFDLGGDSLSAINAILQMERLNVDSEISRQIFEGRTISEIAAISEGETAPLKKTNAAKISDGINATRGVMVLALISGHWLPFFLERLPNTETLYYFANPFLRLGTPSFAIIYGVGLGYYQYQLFHSNPARMQRNQWINFAVVGVGILLLGLFKWFYLSQIGEALTARGLSTLFFSVLLFYFISIGTLQWLFRLLSIGGKPIRNCFILAGLFFAIEPLFIDQWGRSQTTGIIDLGRLMLVAKYNIFAMTGIAMVGMAMGLWVRENLTRDSLSRISFFMGVFLMAAGIVLSVLTGVGTLWFTANVSPLPMIITYAGVVAITFSGAYYFADFLGQSLILRLFYRSVAVTGLLSLMLYVGHELVIPGKAILVELGLSEVGALLLPISVFLMVWVLAGRRLYRLYYG